MRCVDLSVLHDQRTGDEIKQKESAALNVAQTDCAHCKRAVNKVLSC